MAKIKKIKLPNDSTEYEFEGSVTDISDTTSNIDSITTDYPDVSASDKASTLFGKIKKFLSDLKSKKQDNVTGAASTITSSNLTANRILQSDANGKVAASDKWFEISTHQNSHDAWLICEWNGALQHRLESELSVDYANQSHLLRSYQPDSRGGASYGDAFQIKSQYDGTFFCLKCVDSNYGVKVDWAQPVFNNATWYTVGDDIRIGDRNVDGCLCLQGLTSDITGLCFLSQNGSYGKKLYLDNNGNFYIEGKDAYGRAANINPLWLKSLADTNLSSYKLDVDVSFANLENGLFNLYTNWNNSNNMPANYGSGMIIPFLDSAYKMHIYGTTAGHLWLGITQNHTWSALKKFMFGYAQANFTYAVTGIGKIADSNNFYGTSDSGNYYWGVAAWSDKRLKKNIKDSKVNALDLITKIHLKEFDFKDEKFGSHESIGYVAQDLLDVIPEAVQSIPLSDEEDKQKYGADKLYMVEDKHLIKYLVKAVQELTDIVNKQQIEIDELKNRVVALKEVIEY